MLLRRLLELATLAGATTTATCSGTYTIIIRAPFTAGTNTECFRRTSPWQSSEKDPVWLFGNWWHPDAAAAILKRVLLDSWEAIRRIKYHARNLFLERHQFEIRQPCWSAERWRSVT